MIGANAYANADDFFWYEGRPRRSVADAEGYGLNALYRAYQAKGGGWIFLACPFEEEWHALCETIGRGDLLEDPRFVTAEPRLNNDEALAHELGKIFATKDPGEWERDLARVDVCCVEIENRTSYHFWADDPHVSANNLTVEVDSTRWGAFWRLANLLLFSHTQGKAGAAPLKGEHNHAVLQGLGYSDLEITSLEQQGVLIQEQP
jgi:crotonobetainyl-CoA:carnitine CoA-transferase CaiB-like acyl-CoA transferase